MSWLIFEKVYRLTFRTVYWLVLRTKCSLVVESFPYRFYFFCSVPWVGFLIRLTVFPPRLFSPHPVHSRLLYPRNSYVATNKSDNQRISCEITKSGRDEPRWQLRWSRGLVPWHRYDQSRPIQVRPASDRDRVEFH